MLIISRISAWVLLMCFILFILTGLDTRMDILPISGLIHVKYLFIPALIAFGFHSSYSIHLAFKRRKFWNLAGQTILALYVLGNLMILILSIVTIFRIKF